MHKSLNGSIYKLLLFIGFAVLVGACPEVALGQAKKPASGSTAGVAGMAITDGANVYGKPDFDAEVIGHLGRGQRVVISKGTFGDGPQFYKVKVGKKIGYVSDVDVRVSGGEAKKKVTKDKPNSNQAKDKSREREREKLPLYFTRYFGLSIGSSEYKEGISGINASEQLLTYGVRVTGPDVVLMGPVMDLGITLHYGAPTYYNRLSVTKPIGFILLADTQFLLPLIYADEFCVQFGIGPLLALSKFSVLNGGRNQNLTALNLGVTMSLGGAFRVGKVALRLDGKYMIEKQQYKSIIASIQTEL